MRFHEFIIRKYGKYLHLNYRVSRINDIITLTDHQFGLFKAQVNEEDRQCEITVAVGERGLFKFLERTVEEYQRLNIDNPTHVLVRYLNIPDNV